MREGAAQAPAPGGAPRDHGDVLTSNGGSYSSLDKERLIDEIIGMR
ncbi:MAG: hypothetical protein CISAcid_12040 [uncultured Acidilobus sp. CIS]|nr:MAG: hypothetical protein CISAcid_12040 [uncultured Acidilobus sp. CIS]